MNVFIFLNSNLFLAIVSLLVGSFVLWLYFKQKKDFKKGIASIIVLEFRNAEESASSVKNRGAQTPPNERDNLLMPNNSWSKYSYLFTNDFDTDEWDAINNFVNNCIAYDSILAHLKQDIPYQLRQKEKYVQKEIVKLIRDFVDTPQLYPNVKDQFVKMVNDENFTFIPLYHGSQLSIYLSNVETTIVTSSAGAKLKRIAGMDRRRKKFFIF